MTRLLLIRHAETELSNSVLLGRLPGIHLSQNGVEQAKRLQNRMPTHVSLVITSPLERAEETADILMDDLGLEPIIDEAFDELNFGSWAGMRFQELDALTEWKAFNRTRTIERAPGGENLREVKKRVLSGIEHLLVSRKGETIAVVTHGDVIRTALTHFAGSPLACFDRFRVDFASMTEIEVFPDGRPRIVSVNVQG